jgi:hypothetical protein
MINHSESGYAKHGFIVKTPPDPTSLHRFLQASAIRFAMQELSVPMSSHVAIKILQDWPCFHTVMAIYQL